METFLEKTLKIGLQKVSFYGQSLHTHQIFWTFHEISNKI